VSKDHCRILGEAGHIFAERAMTGITLRYIGEVWPPNAESVMNAPRRWHVRGEVMRAFSQRVHDPAVRRMMLTIAVDYDRLAKWAEERTRRDYHPAATRSCAGSRV
jgi:hypothetical protein